MHPVYKHSLQVQVRFPDCLSQDINFEEYDNEPVITATSPAVLNLIRSERVGRFVYTIWCLSTTQQQMHSI
jgi:hypothetical protein